jgi:hypothetical protein
MNKSETKRKNIALKAISKGSQLDQRKGKLSQCWCSLKTFKEEILRRQHMRVHDPTLGRNYFPCNECLLIFPSKAAYNSHLKSEHHQSLPNSNEPRVFGKEQSVPTTDQRTWNNMNVDEPTLHDELSHPIKNSSVSGQNDSQLKIVSTFSLSEMSDVWPIEFSDVNTDLKSIGQQQHQLPNSRNRLKDTVRTKASLLYFKSLKGLH